MDHERLKELAKKAPGRYLTIDELQFVKDNHQEIVELQKQQEAIEEEAKALARACDTLTSSVPPDLIIEDDVAYACHSEENGTNFACYTARRYTRIYLNALDRKTWCVSVSSLRSNGVYHGEKWLGMFPTREEAEAQGRQWVKTATCINSQGEQITVDNLR